MLDFDTFFMREALKLANIAFDEDEVPVGAVVVCGDKIIGKGYNQVEKLNDPTAHAELLAITAACNFLGSKYLDKCTLYVTLEPCMMCTGALRESQIKKVVFAATDTSNRSAAPNLFEVKNGILANEAAALLTSFFKKKRKKI
ncbi:MAG TPA: nucleoside deaminase [Chitinophagales bacterium]|nr:nucleoside deaminase [Chitinophagales bacterium]HNB50128.1 nucleoside deaminase [Chitinophagales bacterium]HNC71262.1 nucleoside deaminase [Chitinophagales bacterium]HNG70880.1 nucleoside deaminase [Chitinophagales bacterium]HNJ00719.1 nucleoside deaminase [Chitinophagales bacterium]